MASVWDFCLGRDTEAKVTNLVHKMNKTECSEEKKIKVHFL